MAYKVVSVRCVLKDPLGHVLFSTFNRNVFPHAKTQQEELAPVSEALKKIKKGQKMKIFVPADKAYGFYDPELVIVRRFDQLSAGKPFRTGELVIYEREGERRPYRILEVSGDSITMDGNHPLAGQDLVYELEATDSREATSDEIEDGGDLH